MMLAGWRRVVPFAVVNCALFCALVVLVVASLHVTDGVQQVVLAKAISLFWLAALGGGTGARHLRSINSEVRLEVRILSALATVVAIVFGILLVIKVLELKYSLPIFPRPEPTNIVSLLNLGLWHLKKSSDVAALVPLVIVALAHLVLWIKQTDKSYVGRVCFVIADLPILLPAFFAIGLLSILGSGEEPQFSAIVGGVMVMLVFTALTLERCAEAVLEDQH